MWINRREPEEVVDLPSYGFIKSYVLLRYCTIVFLLISSLPVG